MKINKSPNLSTLVTKEILSQFLQVIRSSITVIQHVTSLGLGVVYAGANTKKFFWMIASTRSSI